MTQPPRRPAANISAVVSDVDGTLVTDDKILTAPVQAAVAGLRARGSVFTIIISRSPRGLGADFNGGIFVSIAMGNASASVQAQADAVTASYDDEGFAKAIERFVLLEYWSILHTNGKNLNTQARANTQGNVATARHTLPDRQPQTLVGLLSPRHWSVRSLRRRNLIPLRTVIRRASKADAPEPAQLKYVSLT